MLTFIIFIWNLRAYKNLFKSRESLTIEMRKSIEEGMAKSEYFKAVVIVSACLVAIPYIIFYGIAANTFLDLDNKLLILYTAIQLLFTFNNLRLAILFCLDEKRSLHKGYLWRMLHPVNTVFIAYFAYVYTVNL